MKVYNLIKKFILKIDRKHKIRTILMNLTLEINGFGNSRSFENSGEEFFISNFLGKENLDYCLDIGAHSGEYSRLLLAKTNLKKLIMIEPQNKHFEKLKNVENDYPKRTRIIKSVVSNDSHYRRKRLYMGQNSDEHNSLGKNENLGISQNFEIVNNTVLNDILKKIPKERKLDFIKIDVEGFEYDVILSGISQIKKRKVKMIQIEINRHNLYNGVYLYDFSALLPEYTSWRILPKKNGLIKIDPKNSFDNLAIYSNIVFIREEFDLLSNREKTRYSYSNNGA